MSAVSKGAFLKEGKVSSYPESVAPTDFNSGSFVPLTSEELTVSAETAEFETLGARGYVEATSLTEEMISGQIGLTGFYDYVYEMLAMGMGFEPSDSPVSAAGHVHVLELAPNIGRVGWPAGDGRLPSSSWLAGDKLVRTFALGIYKGNASIHHVYRGLAVTRMTLTWSVAGPLTITVGLVGREHTRAVGSYYSSWPSKDYNYAALGVDTQVYCGETDGTSYQNLQVNGVEITVEKAVRAWRSLGSGSKIEEPELEGPTRVYGRLSFPRYEAQSLLGWLDGDDLKLKVVSTTGIYKLGAYLPKIRMSAANTPVTDRAATSLEFEFVAYQPDDLSQTTNGFNASAPNSWYSELSGINLLYNGPLVIIVKNHTSSNIFLSR